MRNFLEQEANMTLTENGAATNSTTGLDCLDLFATIGALRRESDDEIIMRFIRAYCEDGDIAMKLLFYARDVRGGLGERRVFRVILHWLAENEPDAVRRNVAYIAEFGRYDDLLTLFDTPCENDMLDIIKKRFSADMSALESDGGVSLLGKWLPSVNASNADTVRLGKRIARALGLSDAAYRKALSALRARIRIIENSLREKDYTFDYSVQPSKAMLKYRKAFIRNDGERYLEFIENVLTGKAEMKAGNVAPYELVEPYLSAKYYFGGNKNFMPEIPSEERAAINATWRSLTNFGCGENALAVIDTSGSMYCSGKPLAAAVALSLGLYMAERNKGIFHNSFIEFSEHPQLIKLKGRTFADRLRYAASFSEVANTDLEAVFDLILNAAVKNGVPQEELPAKLVIISDMEFDCCVDNAELTNFENARQKYAAHGYALPQIVFWNVAARRRQQPVTQNEQGVALVSGVTPRLFEMIAGGIVSPYALMMEVLGSERYACIAA